MAGFGLLIDRVIIGSDVTGPAESSAGVIDGFDPALADPSTLVVAQAGQSGDQAQATGPSLAQRLREAVSDQPHTGSSPTRNAFTTSPGWHTDAGSEDSTTHNAPDHLVQEFQSKHPLDAVLVVGDERYAVIGGRTLNIGQTLDGYTLVAVQERSATFQGGGIRMEVGIKIGPDTPD